MAPTNCSIASKPENGEKSHGALNDFGLALGPHHITNIIYHNMKEMIEKSVSDFPLRDTTDYCGMAQKQLMNSCEDCEGVKIRSSSNN